MAYNRNPGEQEFKEQLIALNRVSKTVKGVVSLASLLSWQ